MFILNQTNLRMTEFTVDHDSHCR